MDGNFRSNSRFNSVMRLLACCMSPRCFLLPSFMCGKRSFTNSGASDNTLSESVSSKCKPTSLMQRSSCRWSRNVRAWNSLSTLGGRLSKQSSHAVFTRQTSYLSLQWRRKSTLRPSTFCVWHVAGSKNATKASNSALDASGSSMAFCADSFMLPSSMALNTGEESVRIASGTVTASPPATTTWIISIGMAPRRLNNECKDGSGAVPMDRST
mmetsp:Transcript_48887/g.150927  ORF Transcript_48887/g.150927 Transcript_48887/m.150927 type:complete len:212 (+) Transcript_48887:194-829(+)